MSIPLPSASLVSAVSSPIEIEVKSQNPDYEGRYFLRKVYITENLYEKVKNKEYEIL